MLCDLATHTTGLPKLPGNLKSKNKQNPYADYSKEHLYAFLKSFHFAKPIGYDYQYSATGIALLGHALEQKTKTEFEELIYDRLFLEHIMPWYRDKSITSHQQYLLEESRRIWKCKAKLEVRYFSSGFRFSFQY
ncbi:MAG: serine hydrolase [Bacteroidetes bacterium]|nr:serine hydrolase [Bacteroidota bacterium]